MRGKYFGEKGQSLHARTWHQGTTGRPLICLPPAPHTGLYFKTLSENLDHPIIAIDYPGSGSSDPLNAKPAISDYARALAPVINEYGSVHLLGFHTGCLVALEAAHTYGSKVDKLVLIDGPFFDAATRAKYAPAFPNVEAPRNPEDLSKSFETTVTKRRDAIGEARALELWVESLRAGPRYNDPFQAAFAYDVETTLERCDRPVHVIATQSGLLEATRQAGEKLSQAVFQEVLDIKGDVFETGASIISPMIKSILN